MRDTRRVTTTLLGIIAVLLALNLIKTNGPVARAEDKSVSSARQAVALAVTQDNRNRTVWRLWSDGQVECALPKPHGPGQWFQPISP
jgi:hypothetical protein